MIQRQLKLRLTARQEQQLESWLPMLASVWNWAIRKIELDAQDGFYYSRKQFNNLLAGHGQKIGIPSHVLQGVLATARAAAFMNGIASVISATNQIRERP